MAVGVASRPFLAAVLASLVVAGLLGRGALPYGSQPIADLNFGEVPRPEGCLRCHARTRGLGAAHDPAVVGCSSCHLGDPFALDEQAAHRGMVLLAGDLRTAADTCGRPRCHPTEAGRVTRSVMAGTPALLGVDAFALGERERPEVREGDDLRLVAAKLAPSTPAESHVRKLCASCHLGYPKAAVGDLGFESRGGGCTACHLGRPQLATGPSASAEGGRLHPDVSADVSEHRCEGCHSRSGRIALSFHGKVELEPGDARVTGALPDGRPIGEVTADVHAAAGMTCIDCHTERGVMGDGRALQHGYQAVDVRCEDCHGDGTGAPGQGSRRPNVVDGGAGAQRAEAAGDRARVAEVLRAAWRNRTSIDLPTEPILTHAGTPLWRTDKEASRLRLAQSGALLSIPLAQSAPYHRLEGHERLSCQACHSVWAPRCGSCHTRFDPDGQQVDHLSGQVTPGEWIEVAGANGFGPPVLGWGPRGRIEPFVEGMTLQVDGLSEPVDRVLWAPLDPHTTGPAHACTHCHRAQALAELAPDIGATTRVGARLLDSDERGRIRRVARCVGCHSGYADRIYEEFSDSVERLRVARASTASPGSVGSQSDGGPDRAVLRCAGPSP